MKIRINRLQVARRSVQIVVVALMLAVPALSRYANYLSARELDRNIERWDGTLQGEVLGAIDWVLRAIPGGEKHRVDRMVRDRTNVLSYTQELRGGPWSLEAGPLSMTDPLAGAESILASRRVVWVMAVSLLIPLVATAILGRVFCSWICPVGLMLEITDKLRRVLRFLEIRPRDIRFSRTVKYVLLGVGVLMTAILAMPVLGPIYPPAIIGREAHDLVFGMFDRAEAGHFGFWAGGLTWMSLILLVIVLFEITVSRRWWCRYVCPGGALYSLIGSSRRVRVERFAKNCTDCGLCVTACPMGLVPMRDEMGMECDNCGWCISVCDDDAIGYVVGKGAGKEASVTTVEKQA